MISQLKVQLNLYCHREKDNAIITNLDLSNSENPNNKVRELLYSLATGSNSVVQSNKENNEHYINKISELEKIIENLKNENVMLKAENNILNTKFNSLSTKDEISATDDNYKKKEMSEDIEPKKKNSKLLGSIKQMEI